TNSVSTDTSKFDGAGRAISEIAVRSGQQYVRTSTFNSYGLRTALQVNPWNTTIGFHYDALLRLDTLTDVAGGKFATAYNSDGQDSLLTIPSNPTIQLFSNYSATHSAFQR